MYNNSFFDTVPGQRFTSIVSSALPELVELLSKKPKQSVRSIPNSSLEHELKEELEKGKQIQGIFPINLNMSLVIFTE